MAHYSAGAEVQMLPCTPQEPVAHGPIQASLAGGDDDWLKARDMLHEAMASSGKSLSQIFWAMSCGEYQELAGPVLREISDNGGANDQNKGATRSFGSGRRAEAGQQGGRHSRAWPSKGYRREASVPQPGSEEHQQYLHRVSQRNKQVGLGKMTEGYRNYCKKVPRDKRDPCNVAHVHTPRAEQMCSKRSWDSKVREWRRALHMYDEHGTGGSDRDCEDALGDDDGTGHDTSFETQGSEGGMTPEAQTAALDSSIQTLGSISPCGSPTEEAPCGGDSSAKATQGPFYSALHLQQQQCVVPADSAAAAPSQMLHLVPVNDTNAMYQGNGRTIIIIKQTTHHAGAPPPPPPPPQQWGSPSMQGAPGGRPHSGSAPAPQGALCWADDDKEMDFTEPLPSVDDVVRRRPSPTATCADIGEVMDLMEAVQAYSG